MKNIHKVFIGVFLGIIAPMLVYPLVYKYYVPGQEFGKFPFFFNVTLKISVLINLALFFLFLNLNKNKSAQGVLGATILYALFILYNSFFR